jgi:eukaryotic-like serine/threonine-protein kinase
VAAPALVEKAKTRIGSVLREKWKLDSLLGVGGSAAVYAATHRNGKRGAIKLLHPEFSKQEELVKRFLREGYVANKIDHPGSVIILDDDITDDGMAFLVMELLEGYTLERRLRKRSAVPVREALKMTEDLLDVLQVAHEKGIIHRDIKPANIFITKDKVLKVLDFGIARLGEQSQQPVGDTQMGQALGTPAFMPPEQARGRWDDVDVRTDLWSVGATLWALLSGQRPRRAETSNEELLLAMTEPLPAIASIALHVSPEVAKIVDRAVAFEMASRWPNARTMQQAVRLALLLEQAAAQPELPEPSGPQSLFEISLNTPAAVQADFDGVDEALSEGKISTIGAPKSTYGGPLSMSRFDALGPRILRPGKSPSSSASLPTSSATSAARSSARPARSSARSSAGSSARSSGTPSGTPSPTLARSVVTSSATPTGDARLTTSQPIVIPVVAEPLSFPPPKKKRGRLIAVVGVFTTLAVAAAAGQQLKIVDLRRFASRTPDAVVLPTTPTAAPPAAPTESAEPSASPSTTASPTGATSASASPTGATSASASPTGATSASGAPSATGARSASATSATSASGAPSGVTGSAASAPPRVVPHRPRPPPVATVEEPAPAPEPTSNVLDRR